MDRANLDLLPKAYRVGLQLRDLGADTELIAECLGISVSSVHTLLLIGERKLVQAGQPPNINPTPREWDMTQVVDERTKMQAAWDAAAVGDYGPAFDTLADEVRIENGPGAGPWHRAAGKGDLAQMLLEMSMHFGESFRMQGRCLHVDERVTVALVDESGQTADGGVYDNLAVWVERRRPDGLIDSIWTIDLDTESCEKFWREHPGTPSRDFS